MTQVPDSKLSVGIIGAGPGGLALGIFLQKAGFDDFTIFDREDGVGGTWRINTYPGLACDVKSHLYSYSFDLNPNWSRLWAGQPEILEYFESCAERYRLGEKADRRDHDIEAMLCPGPRGQYPVAGVGIPSCRGDLGVQL
ncbi:hypothetical protein A5654_08650 [Mycolicibacterium fortuitum]|nr:hypothetical protein A5654_08650 [Mycolicibacterium fortuitum]